MKSLPVVETFISIQGEGFWAGKCMYFIRLGGCVVGEAGTPKGKGHGFDTCTLPSGYKFRCDTAYATNKSMTIEELVDWVPEGADVCITGGEPIVYDLTELVDRFAQKDIQAHIETSGVGRYQPWMDECWITVSPKMGYNEEIILKANEVKWLVSDGLQLTQKEIDNLVSWSSAGKWVFLQPIYDVDYASNLRYAIAVCKTFQSLRLSIQLHKVVGVK